MADEKWKQEIIDDYFRRNLKDISATQDSTTLIRRGVIRPREFTIITPNDKKEQKRKSKKSSTTKHSKKSGSKSSSKTRSKSGSATKPKSKPKSRIKYSPISSLFPSKSTFHSIRKRKQKQKQDELEIFFFLFLFIIILSHFL